MGTPSLIYFQEDETMINAVIYQEYDGYLTGVGRVLASFLKKVKWSCYPPDYNEGDIICNRFEDLVAQFIQKHKEVKPVPFQSPPAPFYIYPAISGQKEEFTYYVTCGGGFASNITIRVENYEQKSGEMTIEEFDQLCNT